MSDVVRVNRGVVLTAGGADRGRSRSPGTRVHRARVRRRATDLWEAVCSCGWSASGESAPAVRAKGATHARATAAGNRAKKRVKPRAASRSTKSTTPKSISRSHSTGAAHKAVAPLPKSKAVIRSFGTPPSGVKPTGMHDVGTASRTPDGWVAACGTCRWRYGPARSAELVERAIRRHRADSRRGVPSR
jgi:hypothetical protein